ncbi:MAG TPA: hypothetical protein PK257_00335 [Candidatus Woesebacteria bacterium]|nr:hypothetical protein [Candidatus Woesebacteria bacterium]
MTKKTKNNKSNKGQIAIIVLLASAVLLTLGLSSSRKAVTDIKVDTDEELLKEAFTAAESGINNYLNAGGGTYSDSSGNKATVSSVDIGSANSLSSEGKVLVNTPQLFWLVNHNDDGTIGTSYYDNDFKIEAGESLNNVALKVDYYYINSSNAYSVSHFGCYTGTNPDLIGFAGSCSITKGANRPLLVVVTPLGSSTTLTISGTATFPIQGQELTAVGTAGNGVTTQVKTRNIYQLPPFFFEAITAQNIVQ